MSEETKNEQPPVEPKKELTPEERAKLEEVREKISVKMLITFYPDNQEISVENVQNLTRPVAAYAMTRILKTYENDDLANSVVTKLATMVSESKKQDRIWVPGSKK